MSNANPTDPTKDSSTSSSCTSLTAFKSLGQAAKQKQPAAVTPKSIVEGIRKKASDQKDRDLDKKWEKLFKDRDVNIRRARAERGIIGDWR